MRANSTDPDQNALDEESDPCCHSVKICFRNHDQSCSRTVASDICLI